MRRFAILLSSIVFAAAISTTAIFFRDRPPRRRRRAIISSRSIVGHGANKMTRTFLVHVPPGFDGKSNVPVVIMLHGAGGSGEGAMGQTGWGAKSDREGFIAVFPDGTPPNPRGARTIHDQPAPVERRLGPRRDRRRARRRPRLHLRDDRLPRSALRRRPRANLLHRLLQRRVDDLQRRPQPRKSSRCDRARLGPSLVLEKAARAIPFLSSSSSARRTRSTQSTAAT